MADLLPVMHPLYNMREVCKQLALLEDHLNNPRKRCEDCIRKHFLTIEALFEEGVSLDNKGKWFSLMDGKDDELRQLQIRWIDGDDPRSVAQELRALRKKLIDKCFDLRDMTAESRLASKIACRVMFGHSNHVASKTLGDEFVTQKDGAVWFDAVGFLKECVSRQWLPRKVKTRINRSRGQENIILVSWGDLDKYGPDVAYVALARSSKTLSDNMPDIYGQKWRCFLDWNLQKANEEPRLKFLSRIMDPSDLRRFVFFQSKLLMGSETNVYRYADALEKAKDRAFDHLMEYESKVPELSTPPVTPSMVRKRDFAVPKGVSRWSFVTHYEPLDSYIKAFEHLTTMGAPVSAIEKYQGKFYIKTRP